jgi:hypothetical protein
VAVGCGDGEEQREVGDGGFGFEGKCLGVGL